MKLSAIIPIYNEENAVEPLLKRLVPILESASDTYEVIFCMDPCTDATAEKIERGIKENPNIKLIAFAQRCGQALATLAGLRYARGDACIVMDADLQDPPEIIPKLIEKWREGHTVVYGVRRERTAKPFFYNLLARMFYRLMRRFSTIHIPENTGEFRLLDRKAVDEISRIQDRGAFLRGIFSFVGARQAGVTFEREERVEGSTKYSFWRALRVGLDGIYSFTDLPTKVIYLVGFFFLAATLLILIPMGFRCLSGPGGLLLFLGFGLLSLMVGVLYIMLGLIAEYTFRTYNQVIGRPLYIIDRMVGLEGIRDHEDPTGPGA